VLNKTVLSLVALVIFPGNSFADYPYRDVCPGGGEVYKCVDNNKDGKDDKPCDQYLKSYTDKKGYHIYDYWKDLWNFAQCNCTSYAAFMANSYGYPVSGWGNGKLWGDKAKEVGVIVDHVPIPGDVVYWTYGSYGHVAWVEKVEYDENKNWKRAHIFEYNFDKEDDYGDRWITPSDKPVGFIHTTAYNEGVTSLHYLDSYEMYDLYDYQTKDEWYYINMLVWNKYRCKNCSGNYDFAFVNSIVGGFGGNPPDPEDSQTDPVGTPGDDGNVSLPDPSKASKPELFVKELKFKDEKTKYYQDEDIKIQATVKNAGQGVSSSITKISLKLYRFRGEKENSDTKEVDDENIKGENLGSGKTKSEEFNFGAPDEENVFQFYAVIDAKNSVAESNENNNRLGNIRCRIHKRPNVKATNLDLNGGKSNLWEGEIPKITATFENSGGEPFKDVPVMWYLDDVHIADDNMRHWNIEHGDEKHESVNLVNLSLGGHLVKVCAVSNDDQDHSNDCREMIFRVLILGDVSKDKKVDLQDLSIVAGNYGKTDCNNPADLNRDCAVDDLDMDILKENFGRTDESVDSPAYLKKLSQYSLPATLINILNNQTGGF
jgi:surface antigen